MNENASVRRIRRSLSDERRATNNSVSETTKSEYVAHSANGKRKVDSFARIGW